MKRIVSLLTATLIVVTSLVTNLSLLPQAAAEKPTGNYMAVTINYKGGSGAKQTAYRLGDGSIGTVKPSYELQYEVWLTDAIGGIGGFQAPGTEDGVSTSDGKHARYPQWSAEETGKWISRSIKLTNEEKEMAGFYGPTIYLESAEDINTVLYYRNIRVVDTATDAVIKTIYNQAADRMDTQDWLMRSEEQQGIMSVDFVQDITVQAGATGDFNVPYNMNGGNWRGHSIAQNGTNVVATVSADKTTVSYTAGQINGTEQIILSGDCFLQPEAKYEGWPVLPNSPRIVFNVTVEGGSSETPETPETPETAPAPTEGSMLKITVDYKGNKEKQTQYRLGDGGINGAKSTYELQYDVWLTEALDGVGGFGGFGINESNTTSDGLDARYPKLADKALGKWYSRSIKLVNEDTTAYVGGVYGPTFSNNGMNTVSTVAYYRNIRIVDTATNETVYVIYNNPVDRAATQDWNMKSEEISNYSTAVDPIISVSFIYEYKVPENSTGNFVLPQGMNGGAWRGYTIIQNGTTVTATVSEDKSTVSYTSGAAGADQIILSGDCFKQPAESNDGQNTPDIILNVIVGGGTGGSGDEDDDKPVPTGDYLQLDITSYSSNPMRGVYRLGDIGNSDLHTNGAGLSVIYPNYHLQYEVWLTDPIAGLGGFSICDQPDRFDGTEDFVDVNDGTSGSSDADLSAKAVGRWYYRDLQLTTNEEGVQVADRMGPAVNIKAAFDTTVYYRNIRIVDVETGEVKYTFFDNLNKRSAGQEWLQRWEGASSNVIATIHEEIILPPNSEGILTLPTTFNAVDPVYSIKQNGTIVTATVSDDKTKIYYKTTEPGKDTVIIPNSVFQVETNFPNNPPEIVLDIIVKPIPENNEDDSYIRLDVNSAGDGNYLYQLGDLSDAVAEVKDGYALQYDVWLADSVAGLGGIAVSADSEIGYAVDLSKDAYGKWLTKTVDLPAGTVLDQVAFVVNAEVIGAQNVTAYFRNIRIVDTNDNNKVVANLYTSNTDRYTGWDATMQSLVDADSLTEIDMTFVENVASSTYTIGNFSDIANPNYYALSPDGKYIRAASDNMAVFETELDGTVNFWAYEAGTATVTVQQDYSTSAIKMADTAPMIEIIVSVSGDNPKFDKNATIDNSGTDGDNSDSNGSSAGDDITDTGVVVPVIAIVMMTIAGAVVLILKKRRATVK